MLTFFVQSTLAIFFLFWSHCVSQSVLFCLFTGLTVWPCRGRSSLRCRQQSYPGWCRSVLRLVQHSNGPQHLHTLKASQPFSASESKETVHTYSIMMMMIKVEQNQTTLFCLIILNIYFINLEYIFVQQIYRTNVCWHLKHKLLYLT